MPPVHDLDLGALRCLSMETTIQEPAREKGERERESVCLLLIQPVPAATFLDGHGGDLALVLLCLGSRTP